MTSGKSEGNKELISKQQALRIYWPIGMSLSDIKDRTKYYKSIDEALNKYVLQIMNPGTSVKIEWMKKTGLFYHFPYLAMITNVYMINDILEAESQGYAAAMVGPHYDPGLLAAREAAQIPVTGPGESAMMIAQTLGRRFAVLTVREGFVPMIEQNIRVYGYESRVITRRPVRCFSMTFDNLALCMEGKSDEWLVEFEKQPGSALPMVPTSSSRADSSSDRFSSDTNFLQFQTLGFLLWIALHAVLNSPKCWPVYDKPYG